MWFLIRLIFFYLFRKSEGSVSVEEQPSCCSLCQDVLKDPVSTSCGHWFCRQCITSYWDQSASSGDSTCPQCGERSRTRAGLETVSQTNTVQSKTEHLSADVIMSENRNCSFIKRTTVVFCRAFNIIMIIIHSKTFLFNQGSCSQSQNMFFSFS